MRFETLREKLLKAGIAPRHVRRYLRELDDHLADLTKAQLEAGHNPQDAAAQARVRLGGDEELAAAMLVRPEFKSWAARWPWLIFGVAPPLAILAAFFAVGLLLMLIADFHGAMHKGIPAPGWFRSLASVTAFFANMALGPGLAALLVAAAMHQRLNWKWPVLASVIIAIAGFHMVARFPQAGQQGGQIGIGAFMELLHMTHRTKAYAFVPSRAEDVPLLLAQFLLTLAPALWLLSKQRRQNVASTTRPG